MPRFRIYSENRDYRLEGKLVIVYIPKQKLESCVYHLAGCPGRVGEMTDRGPKDYLCEGEMLLIFERSLRSPFMKRGPWWC